MLCNSRSRVILYFMLPTIQSSYYISLSLLKGSLGRINFLHCLLRYFRRKSENYISKMHEGCVRKNVDSQILFCYISWSEEEMFFLLPMGSFSLSFWWKCISFEHFLISDSYNTNHIGHLVHWHWQFWVPTNRLGLSPCFGSNRFGLHILPLNPKFPSLKVII